VRIRSIETYIRNLFTVYQPIRCLRSRNNNLFDVLRTYSQFGDRRFSVMGSKLWNNLPAQIRDSESVSQFKSQLKLTCSSWRMICHQKCRVLFWVLCIYCVLPCFRFISLIYPIGKYFRDQLSAVEQIVHIWKWRFIKPLILLLIILILITSNISSSKKSEDEQQQ